GGTAAAEPTATEGRADGSGAARRASAEAAEAKAPVGRRGSGRRAGAASRRLRGALPAVPRAVARVGGRRAPRRCDRDAAAARSRRRTRAPTASTATVCRRRGRTAGRGGAECRAVRCRRGCGAGDGYLATAERGRFLAARR